MFNNDWKSWKRVKSPSNYTFLLSYDLNIYVLIRTTGWTVGHRERFKRITIKAQSTQCVYETMRFQRKRSSSRLPFSPITLKRSNATPRENATSFICTCVNDVRDVSIFKSFRFRCPHFKCCHPGQRSNACVFDKNDWQPWFVGPKLNVGAIHPVQIIFTRTCRQFVAKRTDL